MAQNIKLSIVTPEKEVVSDDAQIVMAPGSAGEFGVLPGHTPFLTSLKIGAMRYTDASGKEKVIFVSGGFAEVLPDKVTILAESAERKEDIDIKRAEAAKERAEKRISAAPEDLDMARAQAALARAMQRLRVAATSI
jgi:F-type H+-transporting ATPase subunit epsilon